MLGAVKAYLASHPDVTLLRIQGYGDDKDTAAAADWHSAERANWTAHWLKRNGVDCKRLLPVGFVKGGDMREGGAYVTFVNAALKGKPIGGAPVAGGGKVSGNACTGVQTPVAKLPVVFSFARGSNNVLSSARHDLESIKAYLALSPDVTRLRIQGYYEPKDTPEQAARNSAARAFNIGRALVKHGIDCKRLIAVGFATGGDMREGGAYATFVNAALKGKNIGGAPLDGGGKIAGDLCTGKAN